MTLTKPNTRFSVPVALFAALLALLTIFCLPAWADDEDTPDLNSLAGSETGENGLTVSWTVEKDVPGKTKGEYGEDNAWLIVKPVLSGKDLDTLYLESDYETFLYGPPFPLVAISDFNVDGHDDLQLYESMGNRGAFGPIFLYNPQTGKFEQNETFSALTIDGVDADTKILTNWIHSSACEQVRQEQLVKGFDQLELILEEGAECPDDLLEKDQYRYFKRVYKDGKVISEETKILSTDESWD